MTNYLILLAIIIAIPLQSVMIKQNQKRGAENAGLLFAACSALFALLTFVAIEGKSFKFSTEFLPYSVGFAVAYAVCFIFEILALTNGPMSLTLLMQAYSLLIPTFYGVLFLNENIGATFWIGVVLLALCLFLTYFEKNSTGEKITVKWLVFSLLAFLGNGMCSVVQKMQTVALGETYQNEFMVIALAMIVIGFGAFGVVKEKKEIPVFLKRGWYFGALYGLLNGGVVNFGVMVLSGRMPASLQFPLISAGSILASAIFSIILYKERLSKRQWIGFVVGILSVICLNL